VDFAVDNLNLGNHPQLVHSLSTELSTGKPRVIHRLSTGISLPPTEAVS